MARRLAEFKHGAHPPDPAASLRVVVVDNPDRAALAAQWQALEARADGSFFTSWAWVAASLANGLDHPRIVRVEAPGGVVALGIFNRRSRWLSSISSLTAVGDPVLDAPYIEHNGPLIDRDVPEAAALWWPAIADFGAGIVELPGLAAADLPAVQALGTVLIDRRQPSPWRDLAGVRAVGLDVTALMSANSRAQLRRAIRSYERSGAITLERAARIDQAEAVFARMAEFHEAHWRARGGAGAMSPAFRRFHQHVLAQGVAAGTVDLLTVRAGDRLIGYLYNFRHGQIVSAYQSGFAYADAGSHEKPGLVCHAMAIRHYAAMGLGVYDFLAGAARYKTSFADHQRDLVWARLAMGAAPLAVAARLRASLRGQAKNFVGKFYS